MKKELRKSWKKLKKYENDQVKLMKKWRWGKELKMMEWNWWIGVFFEKGQVKWMERIVKVELEQRSKIEENKIKIKVEKKLKKRWKWPSQIKEKNIQ